MATEFIGVRINKEVIKFLRKQANKEGRTLSGMINKYLSDSKNRQFNIDKTNE